MGEARLVLAILLNLLITAAEVVGGILSGSLALLSDALHNLSDAAALLISLVALRLGRRERTAQRTFGYRRAEIMAALLNAATMLAVVAYLFYEAGHRLLQPRPVAATLLTIVASIGLLGNLVTVLLLRRDAHRNLNVRAAYLHLLADTASSLAVVGGGLLMNAWGLYWIDPALTIVIGLLVMREAWSILRQAVRILMQATPEGIDLDALRAAVQGMTGVASLHHVHAWQLDDRTIHFEGHIALCTDIPLSQADELRRRVEELLVERFAIHHVTLQLEYRAVCPNDLVHNG